MSKVPSFAEYVGLSAAGFESHGSVGQHHTARVQSASGSHVAVALHRANKPSQQGR